MKKQSLVLLSMLSVVALLSACAGPVPKADPSEAWIGLQDQPADMLRAENLDGKHLSDGRYFEVKPGAHTLDVSLTLEGRGDDGRVDCETGVSFGHFQAGEHYTLVESSQGQGHSVQLEDSRGRALGRSQDFNCMPG